MASDESIDFDRIAREVKSVIAEIIELPEEKIEGEASFAQDLGIDSLMALEIVAAIEKKYRIQIPEENLKRVKTFNDTLALVREFVGK